MSAETKNVFDVILTIIGMIAAGFAFVQTVREWRAAQRWKRAEQLDQFVNRFDNDAMLRLASVIVDWTDRAVTFLNRSLTVRNDDVLLALRVHTDLDPDCKFPGEQPAIRDAYDALLAFFARLELALTSGLIDKAPARAYFRYWLQRFVTMDRHPDRKGVLAGQAPAAMVRNYVRAYGDEDSMKRLCRDFDIPFDQVNAAPVQK